MAEQNSSWEKQAIQKFANATLKEQRAKRRWGIFFKLFFLFWLFLLLYFVFGRGSNHEQVSLRAPHTALIKVMGPIMAGSKSSANKINRALRSAFKDKGTRGVVVELDSPGGSAVQSAEVYNQIMVLRKKHPKIKIYAVCTDVCASGAYYIAAATNDIYANQASIIGSIGVILNGFGFVDTLQKLGIKARVIKAGKYKDFLSPFEPVRESDIQHAQQMLDQVHQIFIQDVERGRGKRLHKIPDLFSGLVWSGIAAKKIGLIDGFGSVGYVARNIIKAPKVINYTIRLSPFARIIGGLGASFGTSFGNAVLHTMQQSPDSIQ